MTSTSRLRGLVPASRLALKETRLAARRAEKRRARPGVERLEARTLMAYDLGFALAVGSSGFDSAHAVDTDAAGNLLVAGVFDSPSLDLDAGPGEYLLPNAGGYDGFAAKYDPAGSLLWGVHVASATDTMAGDVVADGAGNVLIAGSFSGSIEIGAPGQPQVTLTNGGSNEGYLAKFGPAGNVLWARTFGAAADPRAVTGIAADAAGNVYATGYEGNRLFVAKYSAGGAAMWTKVVSDGTGKVYTSGATAFVQGSDLAVDANANVYVTGQYVGKIDFNTDPRKTNALTSAGTRSSPSYDTFVLKLNAAGTYVWAGSMGGVDFDFSGEIATDGAGNVYVSGNSDSDDFDADPGPGALRLTQPGTTPGKFVVKLDPNRNLMWARAGMGGNDMTVDAAGNVYSIGRFSGTFDADPGSGTFNLIAGGTADLFVSKLSSSGTFLGAADTLAGTVDSGGSGSPGCIAVDISGNIYTSGHFRGTADFNPGAATYSLAATADVSGNPTWDAFVSKLVPSSALQTAGVVRAKVTQATPELNQVTRFFTGARARSQSGHVDPDDLITIRASDLGGTTLPWRSRETTWLEDGLIRRPKYRS